jgi:hypothetical protein
MIASQNSFKCEVNTLPYVIQHIIIEYACSYEHTVKFRDVWKYIYNMRHMNINRMFRMEREKISVLRCNKKGKWTESKFIGKSLWYEKYRKAKKCVKCGKMYIVALRHVIMYPKCANKAM